MSKKTKNRLNVLAFLAPAIFLFVGVLIAPIVISLVYSFFDMHTYDLGSSAFCGFDNYKQLFDTGEVGFFKAFFTFERAYGSGFVTSIKNSLILAFFSVFVQLPISLGLALLLGKKMKGEKALLTINFIPVLISTVIIAQMFQAIYYPGSGLLDAICDRVFHHPEWRQELFITGKGVEMMQNKLWINVNKASLPALLIPTIWQYVGYHMLLMYAGVKGVSIDLREAAMLDGATEGQINRFIVIPIIKPILKVSVIFAVTGSFKSYDVIKLLIGDNYNHINDVPSIFLVRDLSANNYGRASAIAMVLILMCFVFALLISRAFKEAE